MFETFEHTADLGLRIRAGDWKGLLEEAARAMFSVIVANLDGVRPVEEFVVRVNAAQPDDLLHDWLSELLFRFDTQRLLLCQFDVQAADGSLIATVRGEPIDERRHQLGMEIKAITYHGLKVEHNATGWLAEVIVDI
jgi:SHS2 domain-containing protein